MVEIDYHYAAAMDSVNLINGGKPDDMSADEWSDRLASNLSHLVHVRALYNWAGKDMTAIDACIEANS